MNMSFEGREISNIPVNQGIIRTGITGIKVAPGEVRSLRIWQGILRHVISLKATQVEQRTTAPKIIWTTLIGLWQQVYKGRPIDSYRYIRSIRSTLCMRD